MADLNYRPLGLETDVANQNFAGAANPDSFMHAEFYWHEPFDRNKTEEASEKAGYLVRVKGPRQIYVRIMKPGDQLSILETPLREDHKRRFADKWRYFQITEGLIDGGENQPGWKVEEWDALSPEEIHQLKFLRFYTVEQIAGASDSQIQTIMGGLGLRKRAQDACKARSTEAVRGELDAKQKELDEMKERMARLEAMINAAPPATDPNPPIADTEVQPEVAAPSPRKKYVMTQAHKDAMKAAREAKKKGA